MPTKLKDVEQFFERMATLEAKVEALMSWQRWQMAFLAAILLAAIRAWMAR